MIEQTLLGVRAGSFAVALGVHALALGVAGHLPTRTVVAPPADVRSEVELVAEAIADEPSSPTPPPTPHEEAHVAPSHTHPYAVAPDHDAHPHDPTVEHHAMALAPADSTPTPETTALPTAPIAPIAPIAAPEAPPSFKVTVAPTGRAGDDHAHDHGADHDHDDEPGSTGNPLPTGRVTTPSTCVSKAPGVYPAAAREQSIEATIRLEIVVDSSGRVASARVLEHVGYGLDEAAIGAAKASRFSPAKVDGRPVAERRAWSFTFTLR